jgi:predicted oxidoreductase
MILEADAVRAETVIVAYVWLIPSEMAKVIGFPGCRSN